MSPTGEAVHVGTIDDLRPVLRSSLQGLSPALQDRIIRALCQELEQVPPPPQEARSRWIEPGGGFRTFFAVQESDLQGLREIIGGLILGGVLYPSMATTDPPLAAALATAVTGLVLLLRSYRRKRVPLSFDQGTLLRVLQRAPSEGWTLEEICQNLPFVLDPPPSSQAISELLQKLQKMTKEDGSMVALVGEHQGRWRAIDLK